MNVLLVGGAGYIGSVASRVFLSGGAKVTVLDNLLFGGESLIDLLKNPMFKFIHGDIQDKKIISKTMDGIDIVINLAAIVGEPLCAKYPKLAYDTNYTAACAIGDIAKGKEIKKYIFVSTCSNYGINTSDEDATEEANVNPLSLYADTKINAEKYILSLTSSSFSPTIVRFATVFGLSPRMRFDLLVSEFTKQAFLLKEVTVYKPEVFRPLIHVYDAANALFLLSKTSNKIKAEIFNIGYGNFQKMEIIEKIISKIPSTKVNTLKGTGDNRNYRVSFKKIEKNLGFTAKYSLDYGIEELLQALKWGVFINPGDIRYTNNLMKS